MMKMMMTRAPGTSIIWTSERQMLEAQVSEKDDASPLYRRGVTPQRRRSHRCYICMPPQSVLYPSPQPGFAAVPLLPLVTVWTLAHNWLECR